jgi:hypothetical protein
VRYGYGKKSSWKLKNRQTHPAVASDPRLLALALVVFDQFVTILLSLVVGGLFAELCQSREQLRNFLVVSSDRPDLLVQKK